MADIDYGAIQRAVQDSMRNLQADVHRLENEINKLSQRSEGGAETLRLIRDLSQQLARVEQEAKRHDPRSETMVKQIADDLAGLKQRFAIIEKFAQQFSDYLHDKYEADQIDREYRSASS